MKLENIDLTINWSDNLDVRSLRQFVVNNILTKGDILRWSINDIKDSSIEVNSKILRIHAVIII